ncbi:unnamed protein product, partial [Musa textilis]
MCNFSSSSEVYILNISATFVAKLFEDALHRQDAFRFFEPSLSRGG